LTSAAFYLGTRAVLTSWLWSRYPRPFARFMDCAACSGGWFGFTVGVLALMGYLPLPEFLPARWYTVIVIGLCSIVWTPIVSGLMQKGFENLGTIAVEEVQDGGKRPE
jgi:hypothetical protein